MLLFPDEEGAVARWGAHRPWLAPVAFDSEMVFPTTAEIRAYIDIYTCCTPRDDQR